MRNGWDILGPWPSYLRIGLVLSFVVTVLLFVTVMVPTGVLALLLLLVMSSIWFTPMQVHPDRGRYRPETPAFKLAAFFMMYKMRKAEALNPVVSLGFGPPGNDPDHGMGPGFGPPTRLSSYWALTASILLACLDILLIDLHHPFWGSFTIPWFVLAPISFVGWMMTIQSALHVRRLQGGEDFGSVEPAPAVMLHAVNTEIPFRKLLVRSAVIGAVPAILLGIVGVLADWPLWVLGSVMMVSLSMTMLISASKMMQTAYRSGWRTRFDRREFWTSTFMGIGRAEELPVWVNDTQLPTYDEWLQSTPEDQQEENPYAPQITVATFRFPPNVIYSDYLNRIARIEGILDSNLVAIAPIGQFTPDGQERVGTIGTWGFRIWYMDGEAPDILDPTVDKRVRELLCRIQVAKISNLSGIGHCVLKSSRPVTRPGSKKRLMKIDLVPQSPSVSVETFMSRLGDIRQALDVEWVRADRPTAPGAQGNVVSLYFGDNPRMTGPSASKDIVFVNPRSREVKAIDRMNWAYVFHAQRGLAGVNGLPRLIERVKTTEVVDKLVFSLPEGISFEAVSGAISSLKTTSGNEFMEINLGDRRDFEGLSERERIRMEAQMTDTRFTIIASQNDPLKRVFNFQDHVPDLLTGREPGKAKVKWSPGVFSDDTLAMDDWNGTSDSPHLLVAGASGSGKSVVMSSMILQLMYNNGPGEVRFHMIEPKNEMQVYQDIDVVDDFLDTWTTTDFMSAAADMSEKIVGLMNQYNKIMNSHPKRPKNLKKAREIAARESRANGTPLEDHPLYLPYRFFIIEECASLFADALDKEEKEQQGRLLYNCTELARKARSSGIFLITATQYPTNASIPSVIRNQQRRIGMRCQNSMASRVVIEENGLESIRVAGVGKINDMYGYRNFRGFWVQDGDPDEGEQNDIYSTLARLPVKSGKAGQGSGQAPQVVLSRITVPAPGQSVYDVWDNSVTAQAVAKAVETGRKTRNSRLAPSEDAAFDRV